MRNKSLYLLVACVCGTIAAIVASQWLNAQANSGGTGKTKEIYVSTSRIEVGEKITAERIQREQWPADIVPEGATIIPGHGPQSTIADAEKSIKMINACKAIVKAGIAAGKTADQMKEADALAEYTDWNWNFISKERFIDTLHRDLTVK